MVDSEYTMDIHKSAKISIGTVMRNHYPLRYVPNQYKPQKICDKAIL